MSRKRDHISWKTKYAAALLALGHIPYDDAKLMTEDQIISLYSVDHNGLHAFDGSDEFWNLTPTPLMAHREKSKRDKSIVSKNDRINRREAEHKASLSPVGQVLWDKTPENRQAAHDWVEQQLARPPRRKQPGRKLQSRGFEKRRKA